MEITKQIIHMFNTGDVTLANSVFAENYVDHQRPDFMDSSGPKEFREIVAMARSLEPDLVVSLIEESTTNDEVIAFRLHWMSSKQERETQERLRLENGKVIEHWGEEVF